MSNLANQAAASTKQSFSSRFASSIASTMVTRLISNINVSISNVNIMVVQDNVSVGMTIEDFEVSNDAKGFTVGLSDPPGDEREHQAKRGKGGLEEDGGSKEDGDSEEDGGSEEDEESKEDRGGQSKVRIGRRGKQDRDSKH